jgi:environmental stress-induced protein Ves
VSATLLRAADYRVMPWRNGRGSTTELAAGPAGAPLDAFDWRLSIAEVTGDATFSPFPGCDRIITVIAGEGMALEVDGRPHRLLPLRPFGFAGEARVAGRLLGGPTRAFNLMLRRRACAGAVELVPEDGAALGAGEMALVHVVRGAAELTQGGTTLRAGAGETIRIDEAHPGARVRSLMPEGVALLACLRQKVARSS